MRLSILASFLGALAIGGCGIPARAEVRGPVSSSRASGGDAQQPELKQAGPVTRAAPARVTGPAYFVSTSPWWNHSAAA